MSFLEGIAGLGEEGVGAQLPRSFLAPLIARGQAEGLSGASMLRSLRDVGQGIRTQTFYQLAGAVAKSESMVSAWSAMDMESIPTADKFVEWPGGGANTYLSRITYAFRESEGGESYVGTKGFSIQTSQPITPQQAVDMVNQQLSDEANASRYPTQEVLGVVSIGLYHQLGRG